MDHFDCGIVIERTSKVNQTLICFMLAPNNLCFMVAPRGAGVGRGAHARLGDPQEPVWLPVAPW